MSDRARLAAYDVIRDCTDKGAYANLALARTLRARRLGGRDAALATAVVAGTLRGLGTYDAIIDATVSRDLDPPVRDALRMGAHQLLAMRVPAHAALSTTVDITRKRIGHRPAGFVNAVLRTVAADSLEEWVRRVAPDRAEDPIGHLCVVHSHPRWVVESLAEALGDRRDELADLLAADNQSPRVTLVARPGLSTVGELGGEPTISPLGVTLAQGDPAAVPAVAQGRAGVQDAGSQVVALALAEASLDGVDQRWLDLCAGPGGKAALLAAIAAQRGVTLVAAELAPHRAHLVSGALGRLPGHVICADGTQPPFAEGSFDRVLLDAPCTGLGALRRRPEARWRRTPEDLEILTDLQRRLLDSGLDLLRPGGLLVYATCSPVLAETSGVVSSVLAGRDDVGLVPIQGPPDSEASMSGAVQLWPHRHQSDAMFYALLQRR